MIRMLIVVASVICFFSEMAESTVLQLTDGDARFSLNDFNLDGDLQPDFLSGFITDHINQLGLWYRVNGDTKERRLIPVGAIFHSANFITLLYDERPRATFTGEIDVVLSDSPTFGTAEVNFDARYTNRSATSLLDLTIMVYVDWDLGGTPENDTARLIGPDLIAFRKGEDRSAYAADGAVAYEVSLVPGLVTSLDDENITALTNSGTMFGPGNLSAGYQLDFHIPPGSTDGNPGLVGVSRIPEPSTAILLAIGLVVIAWRARRGK